MRNRLIHCLILCVLATPGMALAADPPAPSEPQLRQQIERNPRDARSHFALAELLLARLRTAWAERDPQLTGAALDVQAQQFTQQAQELVYLYSQALAVDANLVEAYVGLAEVQFVYLSQLEEAEKNLQKAYQLSPQNLRVQISLAEFNYFVGGQREQALELLRKAHADQPGQPDLAMTLADLLTYDTNLEAAFAEARRVLDVAAKAQPTSVSLQLMRGRVLTREANRDETKVDTPKLEEARRVFEAVLKQQPQQPEATLEAARVTRALGDFMAAETYLKALIALTPNDPEAYQLLGDLVLEQQAKALDSGQFPPEVRQAEQFYQQILQRKLEGRLVTSQRVQLFYNLALLAYLEAQTLSKQPNQLKAAEARYQVSIGYYERSIALFDAINVVNRTLQKDLGQSVYALAQLLQSQNRSSEALAAYQKGCGLQHEESCKWLTQNGYGP